MKQPVLLCYNLSGEKMQKIRLAAMRLKIRVRPVEKDEYAQSPRSAAWRKRPMRPMWAQALRTKCW